MIIYKWIHKESQKIYIGKTSRTLRERISEHIFLSKKETSKWHFAMALRKYGREGFDISVVEVCENLEKLNEREKYWIDFYNSRNPKFGYNCKEGGEGKNHSKETCEKIRQIRLGTTRSKETRKKIGLKSLHRKIPRTQEYIQGRKKRKIVVCNECKEKFEVIKSSKRKLCSTKCSGKWRSKNKL